MSSKKLDFNNMYVNQIMNIDENKKNSVKLYPALRNDINGSVYGYINSNGEFVIPPKYQRADKFNEYGSAIIVENNLYGIIDDKGEYIVKPIYDNINPFKEGRAVYVFNRNMGVMDEKGEKLIEKEYNYIGDYKEGRAIFSIYNNDGMYLYGYLDRDGNEVIPSKYLQTRDFVDGVALVQNKDNIYELIDLDGNIINTYNYGYVSEYGDGVMVFGDSYNGPFGYINKEGEEIIKPKYSFAFGFEDGIAVVSDSEEYRYKFGCIDINDNKLYDFIYNEIKHLGNGRVALAKVYGDENNIGSNIYAIGDADGKILTDFEYLMIGQYEDGLSYASNNTNTFFIDLNGQVVKSLPTVEGSGELRLIDNIVSANIDYIQYYLDKKGNIIYKPNDKILLDDNYYVSKEKYKPNYNYLIYYPEVSGKSSNNVLDGINYKLKKMSYFEPFFEENNVPKKPIKPEDILNYNYFGDFTILFYKNNILELDMQGYYYPFGAAHGMPSKKTPLINLVTGEFYTLSDLFMGGVYWVGELNKIIENMIKTDPSYDYIFEDAFKGIDPNQSFYIDENNLYIYFTPYEIGPYAAGFVTFKIPFEDIKGMIDMNGVMGKIM